MGLDQLLEHGPGVAAEINDHRALVIGGQLRGQREAVGEGEEQVAGLAGLHELQLLDHLADRHRVAVGQHHALRWPRGARGVDDRVGVRGLDGVAACGQHRAVAAASLLAQAVQ
jgi:hypothetical protein